MRLQQCPLLLHHLRQLRLRHRPSHPHLVGVRPHHLILNRCLLLSPLLPSLSRDVNRFMKAVLFETAEGNNGMCSTETSVRFMTYEALQRRNRSGAVLALAPAHLPGPASSGRRCWRARRPRPRCRSLQRAPPRGALRWPRPTQTGTTGPAPARRIYRIRCEAAWH